MMEQSWANVSQRVAPEIQWYGLLLIVIPTVTILGNLLVIVSVLRFKSLHSAINFLILGLAVADLFVALFVMPYAVYIYVQGGSWYLGPLMCDIYSAADVACSTASILLLAVISFDRYRAVSKPIQYSRQAQNIRRVTFIIIAIWLISLVLASPMVFGVNQRPQDYDQYECRFYNADFSIGSSIISFVIPCFVVLFVYIRIMLALRKREKAARLRRMANVHQTASTGKKKEILCNEDSYEDADEAGRIVAGPVVNMMMLALPSMTTRMRRFERHRHAIQDAGDLDEDEFLDDGDEELDDLDEEFEEESSIHKTKSKRRRSRRSSSKRDEDVEQQQQQQQQNSHRTSPLALARSFLRRTHLRISSNPLPRRATMLMNNNQKMTTTTTASSSTQILPLSSSSPMRKKLAFDSSWNAKSLQPVLAHRSSTSANDENRRRQWKNDRDLVESCTGHSSSSLSDIVNVVTNDFISEAPSTFSRPSSENDSGNNNNNNGNSTPSSSMNTRLVNRVKSNEGHKKKFKNLTRNYSHKHRTLTLPDEIDASTGQPIRRASRSEIRFPAFLRQFSMRSPKIFRQPRPSLDIAGSTQQTISRNCYRDSYRQCIRQPSMSAPEYPASEHPTTSATDTETLSTTMSPPTVRAASGSSDIAQIVVNGRGNDKNGAHQPIAIDFVCPKMTTSLISGSIMTDSMQSDGHQRNELSEPSNELSLMDNDHEAFMAIDDCEAFLLHNPMARNAPVCLGETPDTMPNTPSRSPSMISPPMVTFSSTVHELDAEDRRTKPKSLRAGSVDIERLAGAVVGTPPLSPQKVQNEKHGDRVYPSLPAGIITCDFMPDSNNPNAAVPRYSAPDASSSGGTGEAASRKESNLSSSIGGESQNKQQQQQQQKTKKTVGIARSNGASGGLAVRIVKKTINRKESSLKRKVSKAQRKEKRATKTLGIVVGVFLICWVPFFSMNILNAVCIKLNAPQCEIGYAPFFYSTWIGYMNSFVNPIIYTIFNTEFRRAFKSLILGKTRRNRGILGIG